MSRPSEEQMAAAKTILLGEDQNGSAPPHNPSDNRATVQHLPPEEAWRRCAALAHQPRILDRLCADLPLVGLVGEDKSAQLLYLVTTSRLLERPVSAVVKGPSSGGKSYSVETVLGFFPENAFYGLSGGSERSLAYSEAPLNHRVLVIYEAAGMGGDFATYLLRSLLSEGRLRYETVEKTAKGMHARLIEREGPTGLIVTTTQVKLHPENETRLLSIPVNDTPDQTKNVLLTLAADDPEIGPDLAPWHGLQDWLAGGERRVVIPFARRLAELIPPVAVRLRRDFTTVLGLIRAHALLHRATRAVDDQGRIIAINEDYAVVRELVLGLVSAGVGATVRPETREAVNAVAAFRADHPEGVPQAVIASAIKLDRGALSRRIRVALDGGYLLNREERRGRPHRLVVGDPLPDDVEILPTVEDCCTVARLREGYISEATPEQESDLERLRAKGFVVIDGEEAA